MTRCLSAPSGQLDAVCSKRLQVERIAETLNQCDGSGVCRGFGVAGFPGNMRRDGAIDDTQGFAHDSGLAGEQEPKLKRYAQHPLAHGLLRQNLIRQ